jgi:hypothetical protein
MDDAGAMQRVERACRFEIAILQPSSIFSGTFGQRLSSVSPIEKTPMTEKVDAVLVADVVQRADVGMRQPGDGAAPSPLEALAELRSGARSGGRTLIGDGAIEPRIARAIHLAHAACAKRRLNLVRAEPRCRSPAPQSGGFLT